jgi:hypothetical protein
MRRTPKSALLTLLLLLLAGCARDPNGAPPLDQTTWQPGTGSIAGYVVNRKAGTNVAGTTVSVVGTELSAVTDESGLYRIMNVPAGLHTLTFTQDGYATSRVEGLRVIDQAETRYDTIQAEAFDPFLPTTPPTLTLSVDNGDSFPGGPEGVLSFTVSGTVASPESNGFFSLGTAALGTSRGTSGYLNASIPGTLFPFDGGVETTVNLPTAAFRGETSLHVVAYDVNFNRTEVIRYVTITPAATEGQLGEVTNLGAFAVTFGDTGVFGTLSRERPFDGRALLDAVRSNDVAALRRLAAEAQGGAQTLQPQDYLDEVITWVDVDFAYRGEVLPTAFRVHRRLATQGRFWPIGQVGPEQICATITEEEDAEGEDQPGALDPNAGIICTFRDATAGLEAGVEATYRVEAILGGRNTLSGDSRVTPLPAFYVNALSPANNATNVSVSPVYEFSVENRSSLLYIGAVVFDRVHAEGSPVEWIALLGDASGITAGGIPHNFDGTAVNATLQPFHGYDWQPIAVTSNGTLTEDGSIEGENAVSIAADFFDLLGVGFGVSDGPVNTFSTGDGSF